MRCTELQLRRDFSATMRLCATFRAVRLPFYEWKSRSRVKLARRSSRSRVAAVTTALELKDVFAADKVALFTLLRRIVLEQRVFGASSHFKPSFCGVHYYELELETTVQVKGHRIGSGHESTLLTR